MSAGKTSSRRKDLGEGIKPLPLSTVDAICREYRDVMYGIAFGILRNREDAEDAIQVAFLRLSKNISKVDESRVMFLVRHMAKNAAIDVWRRRKKTEEVLDSGSEVVAVGHGLASDNVELEDLVDTIRTKIGLSREQEGVFEFILNGGSNLCQPEVAASFGMSDSTFRWHKHIIGKKLRRYFDQEERCENLSRRFAP